VDFRILRFRRRTTLRRAEGTEHVLDRMDTDIMDVYLIRWG
jgi:hypothetical protein